MKVEFTDSISSDIVELASSLPALLISIKPDGVSRFDDLTIKITDSHKFQCEIAFDSYILISQRTLEIIWSLNYAHLYFYNTFCKGLQPQGQWLELKGEEWNNIKPQLSWAVGASKGSADPFLSKFNRDFFSDNCYGKVFAYTLLYFISHELFHIVHSKESHTIIEEERNCDFSATNFIINGLSDDYYLERAKGIALGLIVLNVYGIHSSNYDGKTHPFTYDRLIENLSLIFGKENDKIWGFVMALFSLHCTEKGISKPTEEFENFYDAMQGYKKLLESNNN
jgi:hypothetical protein